MIAHDLISVPDDMVDDIQMEIPEAPFDAILLHIKRSIVKFCEESYYWQESLAPIPLVIENTEYEIPAPSAFSVVSIETAIANDVALERSVDEGIEFRYWQNNPFSIAVNPIEKLAGFDLQLTAIVKPINTTPFQFSAPLLNDYREALIAGAKVTLYKMPRKPWTDLQQANINNEIFESSLSKARLLQARGYSHNSGKSEFVSERQRDFF